jgi:hypothetical protein
MNVASFQNAVVEPAFEHGKAHIAATDENDRILHSDCSACLNVSALERQGCLQRV